MKRAWIAVVVALGVLVLLRAGYSVASNRRLVNKLNPVWDVQGHVLSEHGTPISDVELKVSYAIGFYPVGRILEQGADFDYELLRPDTNGSFSFRKQCDSVYIGIDDIRYQIVGSLDYPDEIVFSRRMRTNHRTSDKNLKVTLRMRSTTNSPPDQ
jgi:hypothetical protein